MLDDTGELNQPIFMDLSGYLKSLQSKVPNVANGQHIDELDKAQSMFSGLEDTARYIAHWQDQVDHEWMDQLGSK